MHFWNFWADQSRRITDVNGCMRDSHTTIHEISSSANLEKSVVEDSSSTKNSNERCEQPPFISLLKHCFKSEQSCADTAELPEDQLVDFRIVYNTNNPSAYSFNWVTRTLLLNSVPWNDTVGIYRHICRAVPLRPEESGLEHLEAYRIGLFDPTGQFAAMENRAWLRAYESQGFRPLGAPLPIIFLQHQHANPDLDLKRIAPALSDKWPSSSISERPLDRKVSIWKYALNVLARLKQERVCRARRAGFQQMLEQILASEEYSVELKEIHDLSIGGYWEASHDPESRHLQHRNSWVSYSDTKDLEIQEVEMVDVEKDWISLNLTKQAAKSIWDGPLHFEILERNRILNALCWGRSDVAAQALIEVAKRRHSSPRNPNDALSPFNWLLNDMVAAVYMLLEETPHFQAAYNSSLRGTVVAAGCYRGLPTLSNLNFDDYLAILFRIPDPRRDFWRGPDFVDVELHLHKADLGRTSTIKQELVESLERSGQVIFSGLGNDEPSCRDAIAENMSFHYWRKNESGRRDEYQREGDHPQVSIKDFSPQEAGSNRVMLGEIEWITPWRVSEL